MTTNRRSLLARMFQGAAAILAGAAIRPAAAADAPGLAAAPSILHVGVNVADIEKTTKFYVEALGFTASPYMNPDKKANILYGVKGDMAIKARQIRLGAYSLLLRQIDVPKFDGDASKNSPLAKGVSNLAVRVDDIDRVAKLVKDLGGKLLTDTRIREGSAEKPGPDVLFVTDPDGMRVELVKIG
jgi:catechol 2,3-dioxygenase-like lactoylglutathione lyase family enzyme